MRTIGLCLFAISCLMAGCSTTPQRWYLHGKTNEEFQGDFLRCQQSASALMEAGAQGASSISGQSNAYNYKAAAGAGLAALLLSQDLTNSHLIACLRQAGYTPAP